MSTQLRDLPGGPFPPRKTPVEQDFNSDNLASHTRAHTHGSMGDWRLCPEQSKLAELNEGVGSGENSWPGGNRCSMKFKMG